MKLHPISCVAAGLLASLPAQSLREGYQAGVRALPATAGSVAVAGGALVWFDGVDLVLDDGRSVRTLLSFPSPVFGSFTVPIAPAEVLFAEGSSGSVWRVPLFGAGQPVQLATIPFAYAAVPWDGARALISAKTGGFGAPDNDLLALDLQTGQVDPVAVVPGASGPLAVDAAGDVYYATASNTFPPPPGNADVVRFDRAALQGALGPGVLTLADATTVHRGLDAAGSLALDGDDDLMIVDWFNAQVLELSDVRGVAPALGVLADYAAEAFSAAAVQHVPSLLGPPQAQLEPFQPLLAGTLVVHETAFGSVSQLRFVHPARPHTAAAAGAIPPGPFEVVTTGGPRLGTGVLVLGALAGPEQALAVAGFEQPLFWAFAPSAPLVLIDAPFDAAGTAGVDLVNPGFGTPVTVSAQLLFLDAAGAVVGSAAPVSITLG